MLNAVEAGDIGQLKKMLTNQIAAFQHPLTFDTAMVLICSFSLILLIFLFPQHYTAASSNVKRRSIVEMLVRKGADFDAENKQ